MLARLKTYAAITALVSTSTGQNLTLYLDGNGDGVEVPAASALDVTSAYTFEAWVRFESGDPCVLRHGDFGSFSYQLNGANSAQELGVNWVHGGQGGSWCSHASGQTPAAIWTHVAASFDGSQVRLYRNGTLVKSCGLPQPSSSPTGLLRIGWYDSANGGQAFFRGAIDEVRIWSTARSGQEIVQAANISIDAASASAHPGLVACWNFSGSAADSTGAHDGALVGNASFVTATDIPILDCNGNGVPDAVEIAPGGNDCNANGVLDVCDIATGVSTDCDANGIPDDCETPIVTYCTAGTTVHGCVPSILGAGTPSAHAASGFDIVVSNVPGQRFGTIFYGFYQLVTPWAPGSGSYKCIAFPIQRTGDRQSGGTAGQCNGELRLDFNAWRAANPGALGTPYVAGQVIYAQGWFRDPGAPKQTNLSDGLRFALCN
ncbi:MAG: LamG domain-containing protein [Planctomycetes bacterium]|nr:LamG domain-containing protein [Planctomycetota bacterium]